MTAALQAQTRQLIKRTGAALSGKRRGPDSGEGRRVPRRHSVEDVDRRAQPWRKLGDGSVAHGLAHKEALVDAARALSLQLWEEYPKAEARRRRNELAQLSEALTAYEAMSPADVPIGGPAALLIEIKAHKAWLKEADAKLRRTDVDVLRGLLSFLTDFVTGALFPSYDAIAQAAGVHRNTVGAALHRLKQHGLMSWVRRTTRTGNDGQRGPQLEQTSNAYEFAPRRLMASRTWQTYWTRLCAKLRRFGPHRPPEPVPDAPPQPQLVPTAPLTPVQAALASLGSSIANAST